MHARNHSDVSAAVLMGGFMWYVIQTSTGREEKIKQECEQRISKDVLSHCVLPLYEEKIKYKGQWHIQKKKLFPGYLFLISENLDELHEQLKRVEAMTKLLGAGDDIIALTQNEIDFLLRFAGDEELVKMSKGMIIGDKVVHFVLGRLRVWSPLSKGLIATNERHG